MSLRDPLNTNERDWSALEHPDYEHRYQCACGNPTCWCDDRDASNVRIGKDWYAEGCAAKHPVIIGDVMAAILADEQQDEFNKTRR